MIDCGGLGVGVAQFACISSETSYVMGYALLVLTFLVVFFRLSNEPIKVRAATTMLILSIVTALGSVQNMLFPAQYFFPAAILFIGALFLLFQE